MTRQTKYIIAITIPLVFIARMIDRYNSPPKPRVQKNRFDTTATLPYHTITTGTDGKMLLAYYLQKNYDYDYRETFTEYSALIKDIDPAKDNYKLYCKAIITDIFKTRGNNNFLIYIYDNTRAFQLGESTWNEHYPPLNKVQADTLNAHTVALYYGYTHENNMNNHTLFFYNELSTPYSAHEVFMLE